MKEGSDYSSESDFGEDNYQNAEERVFIDRRSDSDKDLNSHLTGNIKDFIYLSTNFLRAQYDITLQNIHHHKTSAS